MLLLARKAGQSVVIDGNIRVTIERIRGRVVRLKVEAPREIQVDREEVWNRRVCENQSDRAAILGWKLSPAESHRSRHILQSEEGKPNAESSVSQRAT